MLGDGSVNDSPAIVGQDDHYLEQPKRCGRHNEHIDRSNALGLIAQKAAPGRRRRPSSSHHVLGDGRLADLDAELEPAVIFFMDGLGIRPVMWEMGQRLADGGYLVLLPDLYHLSGLTRE